MCAQEQGLWDFIITTETAEMLGLSVKLGPLSRRPKKGQCTLCAHEKCVTTCLCVNSYGFVYVFVLC